jgi:hypothetical protein
LETGSETGEHSNGGGASSDVNDVEKKKKRRKKRWLGAKPCHDLIVRRRDEFIAV